MVNPRSVRFRTTVGAAVALFVLLAGVGLAVNWFVGREVQQAFDRTLLEQARDRAALVQGGAPIETLITPVGDEEVVAAVASDATVLGAAGFADPADSAVLPLGVSDQTVWIVEPGEGPESELLRVAVIEASDGTRFIVGNDGSGARQTRGAVANMLLLVIPLTALAGAAVAWFVTGRALRPVKVMRDELGDVVGANDGRRVSAPGTRDEIDELGSTINGVLDRLDDQSLRQRRFVADASHELKSPLANARAIIDTADPQGTEYQRVTTAVGRELQRLHRLVDDLLYLARDDEGVPRSPRTCDLADLVFDESERVAATTSKRIDASGVVPVEVVVDAPEVTRAIRNLLENAERFAAEQVAVSVTVRDTSASVVVDDDGPGVAPEDRQAVFERFARLDSDRARSAGGTGLGLSIVASIAQRNGGTVTVSDSPLGGAQFELVMPRPER